MSKRIHVGTFRTKPGDITKNRGHDYGMGRKSVLAVGEVYAGQHPGKGTRQGSNSKPSR